MSAPDEDRRAKIRAVADRVARGYGLEIFDVQLRREQIGWLLRIIIDRPAPREARLEGTPGLPEDAISIADCRRVSGDVSAILDAEDTVDQTYILEVSSPGLDRPLRHLGDYRRFAGRLAKIVTSEAIDGQTYVAGRITGVEDDVVVIETGRRTCRIPLSLITRGRLEVDF